MRILIVVVTFDRPRSLERLLQSLHSVEPSRCDVDLIVSIDGQGDTMCAEIARQFNWPHGGMDVVVQPKNLGLKQHIEQSTDLVENYDGVVILEDDLSVSPWMLHYCSHALDAYANEEQVAQISLYSPSYNEFGRIPFNPLRGNDDVYFSRVPTSWGQLYPVAAWRRYRKWQVDGAPNLGSNRIPKQTYRWKQTWKRPFFEYVSSQRKLVVYPYVSLTTNHAQAGANFRFTTRKFEVTLDGVKRDYRFANVAGEASFYDEWFEPSSTRLTAQTDLDLEDVTIDLMGVKPMNEIQSSRMLSLRPCRKPEREFSARLFPPESNLAANAFSDGTEKWCVSLGNRSDFDEAPVGQDYCSQYDPLHDYLFDKGHSAGSKQVLDSTRFRIGKALLSPIDFFNQLRTKPRR